MGESFETWRRRRAKTLEIANPLVTCGHCSFGSSLTGTWSVEGGRLVFRADANPLRGRGPDFESCGESSEIPTFRRITVGYGDEPLTDEQFEELKAAARAADEAEFDGA